MKTLRYQVLDPVSFLASWQTKNTNIVYIDQLSSELMARGMSVMSINIKLQNGHWPLEASKFLHLHHG